MLEMKWTHRRLACFRDRQQTSLGESCVCVREGHGASAAVPVGLVYVLCLYSLAHTGPPGAHGPLDHLQNKSEPRIPHTEHIVELSQWGRISELGRASLTHTVCPDTSGLSQPLWAEQRAHQSLHDSHV